MSTDNSRMKIRAEIDDAPEFIEKVEALANGILRHHVPPELVLIKINNWFSVRWLRFSGKTLGAVGVSNNTLSIPPFVPNRVASQRRFKSADYREFDPGKPIHVHVESVQAILRSVSDITGGAALIWYSGCSDTTERGAIMAYVPGERGYMPWYTGWAKREEWRLVQPKEISTQELASLIQQ
jgi:hypothetical protein